MAKCSKKTRKSYTREQKLDGIRWYSLNGENLYRRYKHFSLNTKTVLRWIKDHTAIYCSKKGRKRVQFKRYAEHPDIEEILYREYKGLHQCGLKVKGWWFKTRGEQLLQSMSSQRSEFKFSDSWFDGFKRRYKLSLRRPTHRAQVVPLSKAELVQSFHRTIRKEAKIGVQLGTLGRFILNCVANVDQIPLPFTFTNRSTYESKGASTVWVQGGNSGLDKRQCTVQLTIFADEIPRVKPLVIFRGTGKRITFQEKLKYDKRVSVCFQENAWCDEAVMIRWVKHQWKLCIEGPTMFCLDQHKAQKTPSIEGLLSSECNTTAILIPPECTSLVQPLDVVVNAPFKRLVDDLATSHMQENLVHGNFSAKQRRILLTAWIGEAWEKTCANRDMIIRGFRKYGISVAVDGSEDNNYNIKGLENYQVDSDDDDPFLSEDDSFEDESDTATSAEEEGTLDSNYTLAESTVLEESITLSKGLVFLPTSCENVENVILNLPIASEFMEILKCDEA